MSASARVAWGASWPTRWGCPATTTGETPIPLPSPSLLRADEKPAWQNGSIDDNSKWRLQGVTATPESGSSWRIVETAQAERHSLETLISGLVPDRYYLVMLSYEPIGDRMINLSLRDAVKGQEGLSWCDPAGFEAGSARRLLRWKHGREQRWLGRLLGHRQADAGSGVSRDRSDAPERRHSLSGRRSFGPASSKCTACTCDRPRTWSSTRTSEVDFGATSFLREAYRPTHIETFNRSLRDA